MFLIERQGYSYDTTMLTFPTLSRQLYRWCCKKLRDEVTDVDDNDVQIERNTHITILYGLFKDNQRPYVLDALEEYGKKSVRGEFGPVQRFEVSADRDVLYISIKSPDLVKLNKVMTRNCNYKKLHNKYVPHMTLAYVPAGAFPWIDGMTPVKNHFVSDAICYTHRGQNIFMSLSRISKIPSDYLESFTEARNTFERTTRKILRDRVSKDDIDLLINRALRSFDFSWAYSGNRGLARISGMDFVHDLQVDAERMGLDVEEVMDRMRAHAMKWDSSSLAWIKTAQRMAI